MSVASNLGFPRMGRRRELKAALERHWAGDLDEAGLLAEAVRLRGLHTTLQQGAGISHVPSGEFSLYDHVLDHACMFGALPEGYGWQSGPVTLATIFALARGARGSQTERAARIRPDLPALEMTKWFDTNYHYLVPRLAAGQRFELTENRPLALFEEAMAHGVRTRPVLLGPVTFLLLSKAAGDVDPLDLLDGLLPLYAQILRELDAAGCGWVQIDEPCLALDLPQKAQTALTRSYNLLARGPAPQMLLASYFGPMAGNLPTALALPVAGLHLDLVRGRQDLPAVLSGARADLWLSLGLVDGRNVWRCDLAETLALARGVAASRQGTRRLMVAPSCSLLHVPADLAQETAMDPEVASWLAFAVQKLAEVATLARGLDEGDGPIAAELQASGAARHARATSARVNRPEVAARLRRGADVAAGRASSFGRRRHAQQTRLALPLFPTTTIGSFPQTAEIRRARTSLARGDLTQAAYEAMIEAWIADAVRWQEEVGLDVLVHGEFERNDMVKYFGEQLSGFAFTKHGWVQSYGSRCVAPPIIWGDVTRPAPMTVRWSAYAQSLTAHPVKGMLTGPVTMLQWSFVRDDRPRETVCRQIALAVCDEVQDLEAAGIAMIQVDEPAFREGLPLRRADWAAYLAWAVECFRLATGSVRDETAIHTHMCYSEFGDIIDAVAALDADAISIETTRSRMELLDSFSRAGQTGGLVYPAEIGPGIWDIHSPRVPSAAEMVELLRLARERLEDWQIWVNPDCGLKTRDWDEVRPALVNLVAAARSLRSDARQG